jgi:hypothetical protein
VNPPVPELIRIAGARWAIEECFQTANNEAGLDHYQVRGYRACYAHITLAMFAAAYLAATRAQEAKKGTRVQSRRADPAKQQRDPPPARRPRPGTPRLHDRHDHLVKLAATPTTPGPRLPLPPPRPPTSMTPNCRCSTNPNDSRIDTRYDDASMCVKIVEVVPPLV